MRKPRRSFEQRSPSAKRRRNDHVVDYVGELLCGTLSLEVKDDLARREVDGEAVETHPSRVEGRSLGDELSGSRLRSLPEAYDYRDLARSLRRLAQSIASLPTGAQLGQNQQLVDRLAYSSGKQICVREGLAI
jgi:hypothetical protein